MASTRRSMARSETESVPPTSLAINKTQRPSLITPLTSKSISSLDVTAKFCGRLKGCELSAILLEEWRGGTHRDCSMRSVLKGLLASLEVAGEIGGAWPPRGVFGRGGGGGGS